MKNEKPIFPSSITEYSVENLFNKLNVTSRALYIIVLCIVIIAILSLFLVKVDVGVTAVGIIKPKGDRILISAPGAGLVEQYNLEENQIVFEGDTLFVISTDKERSKKLSLVSRKEELLSYIEDLKELIKSDLISYVPKNDVYKQSLAIYKNQLSEADNNIRSAENNYSRNKELFDNGIIVKKELEKIESEIENLKIAKNLQQERQYSQFQYDLINKESEINDIELRIREIEILSNDMIVLSPVNGIICNISNLRNNMFVQLGQSVVEISPDGELIAECYVKPSQIGMLNKGQTCKFQLDAFNYNQWGMISGQVIDISNDIFTSGNEAVSFFKIYCSLDTDELGLKNGFSTKIKRGLTLQARFNVTKRTLAQLLYDKIDNWFNPNIMRQ